MKLNETLLSIVFLILMLIGGTPKNVIKTVETEPLESVDENAEICNEVFIDYYSEDITDNALCKIFDGTKIISDGELDVDILLNSTEIIKSEEFALPYNNLGFMIQEIIYHKAKIDIDGKVTSVEVKGTKENAKLTFALTVDLHKKNLLTKLIGLDGSELTATITLDTDLVTKSVDYTITANGKNVSAVISNIACKYVFGADDTEKLVKDITDKLFWGIGTASEFEDTGIIYNK